MFTDQPVFDRMEETGQLHVGQAHRFDVVSDQHSADSVEYSPDKEQEGDRVGLVQLLLMWMAV
jgi:hypothetical protein